MSRAAVIAAIVAAVVLLIPLAVVGVVLLSRLFWGTGTPPATVPDANTAIPRVQEYLTDLHDRDRAAIQRLAPPGYVGVDADIDTRLRTYGGIRSEGADVDLSRGNAVDVVTAHIRTIDGSGQPIQWEEAWFWRDQTWWLLVGRSAKSDSMPGSSTQSPPTAGNG